MPIRFRCVYCNQLLGIARRKAGSVVRCTNCEGQIIVPEPELEAAAASGRPNAGANSESTQASDLFEQNDMAAILRTAAVVPENATEIPHHPIAGTRTTFSAPSPAPTPALTSQTRRSVIWAGLTGFTVGGFAGFAIARAIG